MTYSNFFHSLKMHFDECRIDECKEKGCRINCDKNKFRHLVIFKGEKIVKKLHKNIKICDCFIYCAIGNSLIVALVELKSKSIKPSKIEEKFRNSVEKIRCMIDLCDGINTTKIKFFPILLYKSVNPIDIKVISALTIRFEKDGSIIYGKCNSNLFEIIKNYD